MNDPNTFKRFERVNIAIETFEPSFEVSSLSDGYNESKLLSNGFVTKNRLRRYVHGHKFFNPAVDAWDTPKRQDYSTGTETVPGSLQQTLERYQIRQNGRSSSIVVVNNGGNCNILSVSVDGYPIQEGIRTLA